MVAVECVLNLPSGDSGEQVAKPALKPKHGEIGDRRDLLSAELRPYIRQYSVAETGFCTKPVAQGGSVRRPAGAGHSIWSGSA